MMFGMAALSSVPALSLSFQFKGPLFPIECSTKGALDRVAATSIRVLDRWLPCGKLWNGSNARLEMAFIGRYII